jgi:hypothetical protein
MAARALGALHPEGGSRSRGEDAVEGGGMDVEGAGDFTDGLSFFQESLGENLLLNVHLLWASEANTTFLSVCATGTCALSDKISFELSYPGVSSGYV